MADNFAYFLPRSGVYSQPGAIGGDPAYAGDSKSVSEIDMDAIFTGRHQNGTTTSSMPASWNAPGSMPAGQQHQLSYPESAKTEFAENVVMFNAPAAAVSSDSQSMSPDSNDGVYNVVLPPPLSQQQQPSDNGEDEKLNDADDLLSKRKAQNRAAQRAFRERREKHVRELQDKLEEAEKAAKDVEHENARLKKELEWYHAENKNLKEAAEAARVNSAGEFNNARPTTVVFPELKDGGNVENRHEHQVPQASADTVFLNPSQIWDRLNEHPRADVIDLADVLKRLTSKAHCGGHGPIFTIADVDQAIEAASFE
ncbi:hypothetical protein POJ06DRAFT_123406 [Lipomyces tetrasporus]|uniref:BZIP domain-containing protein n=1 Tax=Lipomyces tetrasporus TaxID=54092 RepID=A0AAD7VTE6_9ASCO|nr:uncharacterized protein POJ06DRAFT_123406 [Lipomyces tetrasporus]KAJ8100075.1 hypothetical protein POJ06DRAFT_123406 [Lipomyces tetrasporus]